jgi:hypothetical protein
VNYLKFSVGIHAFVQRSLFIKIVAKGIATVKVLDILARAIAGTQDNILAYSLLPTIL